jgi:hypothetical protein
MARVRHFFLGQSTSTANVSMTLTSYEESALQFTRTTLAQMTPRPPTSSNSENPSSNSYDYTQVANISPLPILK